MAKQLIHITKGMIFTLSREGLSQHDKLTRKTRNIYNGWTGEWTPDSRSWDVSYDMCLSIGRASQVLLALGFDVTVDDDAINPPKDDNPVPTHCIRNPSNGVILALGTEKQCREWIGASNLDIHPFPGVPLAPIPSELLIALARYHNTSHPNDRLVQRQANDFLKSLGLDQ
jgi:hypothetical protein